jgi:glycosyltransferase involved in cell wall biosynthesis
MQHIHIIYEHGEDLKPFGVAYIRDILPLTHPANASAFQVTQGRDYSPADIILVERAWKPDLTLKQAEELVEQIRQSPGSAGKKSPPCLIYSIDDNLLDLEAVPLPTRQAVRYFCRHADGILVSTEYLRDRLQRLNPRIFVLPNALDERLFSDPGERLPVGHKPGERLTIGFMGTFTHDADLMMALQALRTVLRHHLDAVQLQLVGGIANPGLLRLFQGLPVQVLNPSPADAAYPNFIPWMQKNFHWDIGIAPLENTTFTRSKSDIKFLDYSALGVPGIYSQVPSYSGTVRHLETGWLVESTPAAWVDALETMISNRALRTRLARHAQEYVFSQRTLQHCAHLWREAILALTLRCSVH